MRILEITFAICLFGLILCSDEPVFKQIYSTTTIDEQYYAGDYYFYLGVFPEDEITINIKTEDNWNNFQVAFFDINGPTEEGMLSVYYDTPSYKQTKISGKYSTNASIKVPSNGYYLVLHVVLDNDQQNFYLSLSSNVINTGVGIIVLIVFLPLILLICLIVCILRCFCGLCKGSGVSSNYVTAPQTNQAMYTPTVQPQAPLYPSVQPQAPLYPPAQQQPPLYVPPAY